MSNYSPGVLEHARNTTNHLIPDLLAAPMRITAAEFGAKKATELMGGRTTPAIKFFRESSDTGDVEGSAACGDSEIHVRSNLSPEQCVEVAAHETAHALGERDEHKCDQLGASVKAAWREHRHSLQEALTKRWNEHSDRFLSMPAANSAQISKRIEAVCAMMGVQPFQAKLATEELGLRLQELERLDHMESPGPARYLQIGKFAPAPPRARFSYER